VELYQNMKTFNLSTLAFVILGVVIAASQTVMNRNCPLDYRFQTGNNIGGSNEIETITATGMEECGKKCTESKQCKSIQWSESLKQCVLLTAESADGPQQKDYQFCSKMIEIEFIAMGWTRCRFKKYYGSFQTLREAERACLDDERCDGIDPHLMSTKGNTCEEAAEHHDNFKLCEGTGNFLNYREFPNACVFDKRVKGEAGPQCKLPWSECWSAKSCCSGRCHRSGNRCEY